MSKKIGWKYDRLWGCLTMRIDICTLFPDMCEHVLDESITGRAKRAGHIDIRYHHIRYYSEDKHRRTDDSPYGGGSGMVMQAEPLAACVDAVIDTFPRRPHIIYMSPQGQVLTQKKVIELSKLEGIVLVCGHYEGVDQRFIDTYIDEELSIGDYVLTGGEIAAMVVTDAVARMCDGVLRDEASFMEESHYNGLLEYPHYTRPPVWRGMEVPEVLQNGHHANIINWRRQRSLENTWYKRPDLLEKAELTGGDRWYLEQLKKAERSAIDDGDAET